MRDNSAMYNETYREDMDFPMENLTITIFDTCDQDVSYSDAEIVEHAVKKILMLKAMLRETGFSKEYLQICMEH